MSSVINSLLPGDALRIESASGLVLVVLALLGWGRRWVEAWREEGEARRLAQLDERTLRDIGLGFGSGSSLAARAHAYRQRELRCMAMAQLGLMQG